MREIKVNLKILKQTSSIPTKKTKFSMTFQTPRLPTNLTFDPEFFQATINFNSTYYHSVSREYRRSVVKMKVLRANL